MSECAEADRRAGRIEGPYDRLKRWRVRRWNGKRRAAIIAGLSGNDVLRINVVSPARDVGQRADGRSRGSTRGRTRKILVLQHARAQPAKIREPKHLDSLDLAQHSRCRGPAQPLNARVYPGSVKLARAILPEDGRREQSLCLCRTVHTQGRPEDRLSGAAERPRDERAVSQESGAGCGRLGRLEVAVLDGVREDLLEQLERERGGRRRHRRSVKVQASRSFLPFLLLPAPAPSA